jgi:hypothetical protein
MRARATLRARRRGFLGVALVVLVAALYFGDRLLTQPQFIETSIQPKALMPGGPGDTIDFSVLFAWTEGGYCVGQFRVTATETTTQVRVGPVISRRYLYGACAGLGTTENVASVELKLTSPVGKRAVVRNSDGVALPVYARWATLGCNEAIASRADPTADLSVVLNQVALPTFNALQANRSGESDPRARLFAKQGLFVASGTSFVLIVPAEWEGRLTIGWGSPPQRTTHLLVSGCKATGSQERWLVFAGGFWVAEPACVPLLVKSAGQEQTVLIGVGAACPGQAAPPPGN